MSYMDHFVARQPRYNRRRRVLRPMLRAVGSLFCHVDVTGLERIPVSGPTLLMTNHISFIDPIVYTAIIQNRYVISMAKAETLDHWFVGKIVRLWGNFIINRETIDRTALTSAIDLLQADNLVLIAAEGTRNPDGLGEGRSGTAYIAHKANAVIVPAAITGAETWAHDLRKMRRARVQVNFGQPFRFHLPDGERLSREVRDQMITEAMYQLALTIPDERADLRGHYTDVQSATERYIKPI